ncbi:MAG: LiaF-related protein [Corynebacterium sp.]|nr:LiaF-related protein [Corynebacterium sp.]
MNLPLPFQSQREHAQQVLTKAVGEGRLDLGTYSDLVGVVWSAEDELTLERVLQSVAISPQQMPTVIPDHQRNPKYVSVFGSKTVSGSMHLHSDITAAPVFGDVKLDFREALMNMPELIINVVCLFGSLKLIVPKGVMVNSEVFSIFAEEKLRSEYPVDRGGPRIYLQGINVFGSIRITTA